jgi:steroid 5-alpha reductase family enzyme
MLALLVFLLLVAMLFGAATAVNALWWIAIIALAMWLLGFALHRGSGRGRWYYR